MRSENELLQLIRTAKRKKISPMSISLSMDTTKDLGDDHEVKSDEKIDIPKVHYTMDENSVVGYIKIAAQLMAFEKKISELHRQYKRSIECIYGPLMSKLCTDYENAYNKKVPALFDMKTHMVTIRTLARELALRENRDEAIFDGKRIENELEALNGDDDK